MTTSVALLMIVYYIEHKENGKFKFWIIFNKYLEVSTSTATIQQKHSPPGNRIFVVKLINEIRPPSEKRQPDFGR